MKRIISAAAILAVVLLILSCSQSTGQTGVKGNLFNETEAVATVAELTSQAYEGRMTGTPGGNKAAGYIEQFFKSLGLETTVQDVPVLAFNYDKKPVFTVLDKAGQSVLILKHHTDYSEYITGLGVGGSGKGVFKKVTRDEALSGKSGPFVLMSQTDYDATVNNYWTSDTMFRDAGIKILVHEVPADRIPRKKLFPGLGKEKTMNDGFVKVGVTPEVFAELVKYAASGFTFDVSLPFTFRTVTGLNVIGYLKAAVKTDKTLFVTAHYDHCGIDPSGDYYPGALDNASGTAAVMAIADYFSKHAKGLKRNVCFIALTGEEEGLTGSFYYGYNPVYPVVGGMDINIDMIGSNMKVPVSLYSQGSAEPLHGDLMKLFKKAGFEVLDESGVMGSDDAGFANAGIPAVSVIEYATNGYHTPADTFAHTMDAAHYDAMGELLTGYLLQLARK